MNQTSLVGRPLHHLTQSLVRFAEKRGVWSYGQSSDPALARSGFWGASPNASTGIAVNESSAYTYSVFWACVNNISTDIGSFPLNLYKRDPNGGKTLLTDHALFPLLHDAPNPEMSAFTFRGLLTSNALTWGMGFAEIVRNGAGRPVALWPITPDRVNVRRHTHSPYSLYYEVSRQDGSMDRLLPEQMFVLPGSTCDGVYGRNVVSMARESIGLGLAAERFGGTFFGNGATFGGVFEHPSTMSDNAIKNFRESINAQHQGVERAHKFIVTEEGMKYAKLGIDPNAAQFLETRQHQVEEMCRWFRMPPHKVQHLISTSYNSAEQMNIEYSTDTLTPWCVRWEQELLRQLIMPSEKRIQFFKHNMDSKLRGDTASRYEAYTKGIQNGFLSADDVREKEDMNPLPNGAGKKYFLQSNTQPLDRVDEIIDKQVAPDPKPVAPAAKDDGAERMVEMFRAQLEEALARVTDTTAQITTVQMDNIRLKESNSTLEIDSTALTQQLADQIVEASRLQALVREGEAYAAQLAAEKAAAEADAQEQRARREENDRVLTGTALAYGESDALVKTLQAERDQLAADCASSTARVEQMTQEHADAVAALHITVESEQQARALDVAAKQAAIKVAEEARDEQIAELSRAEETLRVAQGHALTLEANVEALRAEVEALTAAREQATAEAAAATTAASALRQASEQATAEHLLLLAEAQAARAKAEAEAEALRAAADLATEDAKAAKAEAGAVATQAALAEQASAEATAQLIAERVARTEVETALATVKHAEKQRKLAMIPLHRKAVEDVVGRLITPERDRATRNQGSPEKLRAWSEAFYLDREDIYVKALSPVIAVCLHLMDSDRDVDAYIRELVRPQLLAAMAQIRTVANGDPDDYPASLERLLTRWEKDRPAAIAALIEREELTYVANL